MARAIFAAVGHARVRVGQIPQGLVHAGKGGDGGVGIGGAHVLGGLGGGPLVIVRHEDDLCAHRAQAPVIEAGVPGIGLHAARGSCPPAERRAARSKGHVVRFEGIPLEPLKVEGPRVTGGGRGQKASRRARASALEVRAATVEVLLPSARETRSAAEA